MINLVINRFVGIVFIPLKVSADEEKEKGCLCLAPGTFDILDENTPETSFVVNVNGVPDLPSSTEGTLNSNNYEVIDDTDPDLSESNQPTLEQNIDLNGCVASVNTDNLKMLSLLDFAGHNAYYACHHIFFSPRAFFILVIDMTKDLSAVAKEACRKDLIYSEWTYAGRILFL